jgi:hypothetical protein
MTAEKEVHYKRALGQSFCLHESPTGDILSCHRVYH